MGMGRLCLSFHYLWYPYKRIHLVLIYLIWRHILCVKLMAFVRGYLLVLEPISFPCFRLVKMT